MKKRGLLYWTCGTRTITRSQSYHARAQLLQQAGARIEGAATAHDAGGSSRSDGLHAGGEQERDTGTGRVRHRAALVVPRVLFEQRLGRERDYNQDY